MTRLGMSDLITRVRQYSQADENEYTLAGETYWTDDHLQDVLDRNRLDVWREPLLPEPSYNNGGTVEYYDYYFAQGNAERAESGSIIWQLENSVGSAIGTGDYTVNYHAKHIRFSADTAGSAFYLTYRSYNPEMAAADIWDAKAANIANRFDIRTDNHDLKRSQLYTMYTKEATKWRNRALASGGAGGSGFKMLTRSDLNA